MDGLTPGRMVHYVAPGAEKYYSQETPLEMPEGTHCAAVVTGGIKEQDGIVTAHLHVFTPCSGPAVWTDVPYSETMEPHTWHWIERA